MTLRDRKPRNRSGFEWQYRTGCECLSCPWKGNCRGESTVHWRERKIEDPTWEKTE